MNQFISPSRLPSIRHLTALRSELVVGLVYSLKISDVASNIQFARTRAAIKQAILLEPVEFGMPERRLYAPKSNISGVSAYGAAKGCIHEISFPFTGSPELFEYAPEHFVYRQIDGGLLKPEGGRLVVRVNLPFICGERAVEEARRLSELTRQSIASHNALVDEWSAQMEGRLDYEMDKKREELLRMHGMR